MMLSERYGGMFVQSNQHSHSTHRFDPRQDCQGQGFLPLVAPPVARECIAGTQLGSFSSAPAAWQLSALTKCCHVLVMQPATTLLTSEI